MTFSARCSPLLFAFAVLACSPAVARNDAPPAIAHPNIVYAHDQMIDVFVNPAATADNPAPVLVYFHGGAWARGERPKTASSFNSFMRLGFSVVSVDYRLTAQATAPAAVTDALCALSWTQANADKYHFDASRIVAYGTSAGGHLALMAGMLPRDTAIADPKCGPVPHVAAVLDYYGPTDLGAAFKTPRPSASLVNWLGPVEDPAALARQLSPINYVRAGLPPVFIVHGTLDPTVPYAQSVLLFDALKTSGVSVEIHTVPGAAHGKFTDEEKTAADAAVKAFLHSRGVLKR